MAARLERLGDVRGVAAAVALIDLVANVPRSVSADDYAFHRLSQSMQEVTMSVPFDFRPEVYGFVMVIPPERSRVRHSSEPRTVVECKVFCASLAAPKGNPWAPLITRAAGR